MSHRLVVLASPYTGDIETNILYTRRCVRDSLLRGEAPFASHLLYTQPGVLDDNNPAEREKGMAAGATWIRAADALVVYADHGISSGMQEEIEFAKNWICPVEIRYLEKE